MKNTAIVFARAPRLGAVKRRLAREIGDRAALRFHTATLTALLRALAAERRFRTILALSPDRARFRLPRGVARIGQGQGDLGQRMARALGRFPRGRAAVVGCDIPAAGPADLIAAFRALGRADAAFGPATAGGYWLVALGPRRAGRPVAGGGGGRLLAGGARPAPPGAPLRPRALVRPARTGRHPRQFRRPARRAPARVAGRGPCRRSAGHTCRS